MVAQLLPASLKDLMSHKCRHSVGDTGISHWAALTLCKYLHLAFHSLEVTVTQPETPEV